MSLATSLVGVRVIEIAAYLPGPACGAVLASLGARVTKIARPGGDALRSLPFLAPADAALNGAKEQLELDLKQPAGAAALRELAATADVLIDGLRPGALTRLELGYEQLRATNPGLIYCAMSGFGLGPEAGRAGHDLNFVALSGVLAATGAGGPAIPSAQLADMLGGMTAATAILAALQGRAASGVGCLIDASLLGAARWLMAPWHAAALAGGSGPGALAGEQACYRLYATADGRHLAVGALEPHFWARFCEAIGRPELAAQQFAPDQHALAAAVAAVVAQHPLEHWVARFAGLDACVTPVLTVEEAARSWQPSLGLPATVRPSA